jgi:hypothetical protein
MVYRWDTTRSSYGWMARELQADLWAEHGQTFTPTRVASWRVAHV